jgi:hypothetical protein
MGLRAALRRALMAGLLALLIFAPGISLPGTAKLASAVRQKRKTSSPLISSMTLSRAWTRDNDCIKLQSAALFHLM